jgi:heptaprenyl diphosphate synthase
MNGYLVPSMAKKYLEHGIITRYTELPRFPHCRAELLYTFLQRASEADRRNDCELLPLATTLMQVALDTHDMVSNPEAGVRGRGDRKTQLRVLAGDYFSSRFYQLLAQAGQIDWVARLSDAICEINRLKVSLYMKMKQLKLTAEEYLKSSVQIKSALFMAFTHAFEGAYRKWWPEVLEAFTFCEVIADELERSESPDGIEHSWTHWYLLQRGDWLPFNGWASAGANGAELSGARSELRRLLEARCRHLSALLSSIRSDKLAGELSRIAEPFVRKVSGAEVLEEI